MAVAGTIGATSKTPLAASDRKIAPVEVATLTSHFGWTADSWQSKLMRAADQST